MVDFDPDKDAKNIRKHGISLRRYDDLTGRIVRPDVSHSQAEDRFLVIGEIDGSVWVAVTTWRSAQERIISLRPASRKERKYYGEATAT